MSLIIEESDLQYIGEYTCEIREHHPGYYDFPDGTVFVLNKHANGIEYLILKYTMKTLGYPCKKIACDDEDDRVCIYTSYPYSKYKLLCEK